PRLRRSTTTRLPRAREPSRSNAGGHPVEADSSVDARRPPARCPRVRNQGSAAIGSPIPWPTPSPGRASLHQSSGRKVIGSGLSTSPGASLRWNRNPRPPERTASMTLQRTKWVMGHDDDLATLSLVNDPSVKDAFAEFCTGLNFVHGNVHMTFASVTAD